MQFKDKVVWITGGGSGIGFSVAKEFAKRGAIVAISGRRVDRLNAAVDKLKHEYNAIAIALPCDVTDEHSVASTVDKIIDQFGKLDVVLANAGFGVAGTVRELDIDSWRRQFDVNVIGVVATAKYAIPHLEKTKGRLGLVGSVAGTIAFPGLGPYHASKYAVRAIGQILAMELHDTGVSCTTIQPGFVESEIGQVDNEGVFHEEFEDHRPKKFMWSSERAASVMVDALYQRKREFTFTGHGKIIAFFGKHTPGLVHLAATTIGKKKIDDYEKK